MATFEATKQLEIDVENAKEKYKHGLEVKRHIIDKVLLGLIVAAFGYFLNMGIESYKNDLSEKRFLLESRLSTLKDLRAAYNDIAEYTYQLTHVGESEKTNKAEIKTGYQSAIDKFIRVANTSNLLFSENFDQRINYHVWFHLAVVSGEVSFTPDEWPFAVDVFFNFDDLTRIALREEAFGIPVTAPTGGFKFIKWDSKTFLSKSPKHFFKENMEKWRRANQG